MGHVGRLFDAMAAAQCHRGVGAADSGKRLRRDADRVLGRGVIFSQNFIASCESRFDQRELAQPLFERAIAIREKVLGPEHPYTAQTLNNLAVLLKDQGDLPNKTRSIVSVSGGRCSSLSQYRTVRSPRPTASEKAFTLHCRPGWSILPPGRVPRNKCQSSSRPKVQWARSDGPSFEPLAKRRSFPLFRRAADRFREFSVFAVPSQ
jgi:hypothetical protein